jgi:hypothetical protein
MTASTTTFASQEQQWIYRESMRADQEGGDSRACNLMPRLARTILAVLCVMIPAKVSFPVLP